MQDGEVVITYSSDKPVVIRKELITGRILSPRVKKLAAEEPDFSGIIVVSMSEGLRGWHRIELPGLLPDGRALLTPYVLLELPSQTVQGSRALSSSSVRTNPSMPSMMLSGFDCQL